MALTCPEKPARFHQNTERIAENLAFDIRLVEPVQKSCESVEQVVVIGLEQSVYSRGLGIAGNRRVGNTLLEIV